MSDHDLNKLAIYNGEKARGVVHTAEWDRHMAELQTQFDAEKEREIREMRERYADSKTI